MTHFLHSHCCLMIPCWNQYRNIQTYMGNWQILNSKCQYRILKKIISIQNARCILVSKNRPVTELWNKKPGPPIFSNTMSRNNFKTIMTHLRFDDVTSRRQMKSSDKFRMFREIWEKFIYNSQACYIPGPDLTIDEQLFPCKSRCSFIQYMSSKPNKFGIKFWCLAEKPSKYLCNSFPYLGKDPIRNKNVSIIACLWTIWSRL